MPKINGDYQRIMNRTGGNAFPGLVNFYDADTGETLYNNKDIAWMAKSVFQGNGRISPPNISVYCTGCNAKEVHSFEQVFSCGWRCSSCELENSSVAPPKDEEDFNNILLEHKWEIFKSFLDK
jgi:hypothetical protein